MRHIPNILSSIRILLVPVFVVLFLREDTTEAAAIIILSGITDFLDGFLARRFGWSSQLGKVLDPIADKLTQIAMYILFIIRFPIFRAFLFLLIAKEVIMLTAGAVLLKQKVRLEGAKWFGKVVTFLFYITVISMTLLPTMSTTIQYLLVISTSAAAVLSLFLYILEFRRLLKENKNGSEG